MALCLSHRASFFALPVGLVYGREFDGSSFVSVPPRTSVLSGRSHSALEGLRNVPEFFSLYCMVPLSFAPVLS